MGKREDKNEMKITWAGANLMLIFLESNKVRHRRIVAKQRPCNTYVGFTK